MKHKITAKKRSQVRVMADLAREAGLSNPVGRAAYLVNRLENAGIGSYEHRLGALTKQGRYEHIEQEIMSRVKPETAERWLAQYKAGINLRKTAKGWEEYDRAGQEPHGCYTPGAHKGTREDPYTHNTRQEARNCWQRHLRRQERKRRETALPLIEDPTR